MGETVKAAYFEEFGDIDEVLQIGNIELLDVGEAEVRINVEAAGVNPVDAAIVGGYMDGRLPHVFPVIPGWDVAGTVEERGHAARRFNVGDPVYGYVRRPTVRWGTFAEQLVIPESYLATQPEHLTPTEAGGLPLAGLTAYQSLYTQGQLQAGQTALIIGASGGVGSFAIQLSEARGAHTICVASGKHDAYMRELGADDTIDYTEGDIGEMANEINPTGVDLIFDCAGGSSLEQSLKAVKPEGTVVSITTLPGDIDTEADAKYVFVEPNSRQLDHMRELANDGKLEVPLSNTYSLDNIHQALHNISSLHTQGKTVVEL